MAEENVQVIVNFIPKIKQAVSLFTNTSPNRIFTIQPSPLTLGITTFITASASPRASQSPWIPLSAPVPPIRPVHRLTSERARTIFQSSRAMPGGVTAVSVCWARPSVFT